MKIKFCASIICADYSNLAKEINELNESGIDGIHHDIMDGVFVPNFTHGPDLIRSIRPLTKLKFDTHLMIINPEKYIERFIKAGSDIITIHIEVTKNIPETVKQIKQLGAKAMLSVNPDTEIDKVFPYLDLIDGVLVMSVYPGFAGQKFIPEVLPKIEKLREQIEKKNYEIDIQVDGGINPENIATVVRAGANFFVIGNALFSNRPFKKAVSTFHNSINL